MAKAKNCATPGCTNTVANPRYNLCDTCHAAGKSTGKGKADTKDKGGKPKCPVCPSKRPGQPAHDLPDGRLACLECVPRLKIVGRIKKGKDQQFCVVQTYENGVQKPIPFRIELEGEATVTVQATDPAFASGTFEHPIPPSQKRRKLHLDIIGGDEEVPLLDVEPYSVPKKRTKTNHKLSPGKNFLRALRGEK